MRQFNLFKWVNVVLMLAFAGIFVASLYVEGPSNGNDATPARFKMQHKTKPQKNISPKGGIETFRGRDGKLYYYENEQKQETKKESRKNDVISPATYPSAK